MRLLEAHLFKPVITELEAVIHWRIRRMRHVDLRVSFSIDSVPNIYSVLDIWKLYARMSKDLISRKETPAVYPDSFILKRFGDEHIFEIHWISIFPGYRKWNLICITSNLAAFPTLSLKALLILQKM